MNYNLLYASVSKSVFIVIVDLSKKYPDLFGVIIILKKYACF